MLNKVMLIGTVGREPECKTFASGTTNAVFSMATQKFYKDKSGEKKTETTWHNIIAWSTTASIVQRFVHKGSKIYLEGELKNEEYEKDGQKRYVTKIMATSIVLLGEHKSKDDGAHEEPETRQDATPTAPVDDDLPF